MKISIIIPVYNAEDFIFECYNSIKNQTYKDLEVIFINDCSTDSSYSKLIDLQELYRNIKIINNKINKGAAFSRNEGIKIAKGEYIYFMDVDDIITPNCIELLANTVIQYNNPDIICSNFISEEYKYNNTKETKYLHNNDEIRKSYFNHEIYEMPWNKLINTNYVITNSLFFEDIYHEDTPWSFAIALTANSMVLLPHKTYNYRTFESSKMSIRKDIKKIIHDQYISFQSMYNLARKTLNNKSAFLYLTYICNSHLFLIIRTKEIPQYLKEYAYKTQREQTSFCNVCNSIFSIYTPFGIKIVLLYRFLPFAIGLKYLEVLAKRI